MKDKLGVGGRAARSCAYGPQVPLLKSAGLRTLNEGSGHRPDCQPVAAILPSSKMLDEEKGRRVSGWQSSTSLVSPWDPDTRTHPSVFQHLLNPPIAVSEAVPQPEPRRKEDHDGFPNPEGLP